MTQSVWSAFLIETLQPVLMALGSLVAAYAVSAIRTHIRNSEVAALAERLVEVSSLAVHQVETTFVRDFQANSGGKLPGPAARQALEAAVAQAREYLGPQGIGLAKRIIGTGEVGIDNVLRAAIEREIARLKLPSQTNVFLGPEVYPPGLPGSGGN